MKPTALIAITIATLTACQNNTNIKPTHCIDMPPYKGTAAFEKMKTLVGKWSAESPMMGKMNTEFRLIAGGSVVLFAVLVSGEVRQYAPPKPGFIIKVSDTPSQTDATSKATAAMHCRNGKCSLRLSTKYEIPDKSPRKIVAGRRINSG